MVTRIPAGWTCFSACNFVFMGGDRRFVDPGGGYRPPFARRTGIRLFARLVSVLGGQKVTDTTSGFMALSRKEKAAK